MTSFEKALQPITDHRWALTNQAEKESMPREYPKPPGFSRLPEELIELGKRREAWKAEGAEIRKAIPGLCRRAMQLRKVSINTCAFALDMRRQSLAQLLYASDADWMSWFSLNIGHETGTWHKQNRDTLPEGEVLPENESPNPDAY